MADAGTSTIGQRIGAVALLIAAGIVSLPLAALLLDDEGTENYIVPAQLVWMAVVGAVVGLVLPGLAGADASPRRAAWVGALVGVGTAVVGVVIFFLLLSGFDGA